MRLIPSRRRSVPLAILGLCVLVTAGIFIHKNNKKKRKPRKDPQPTQIDFVSTIKPILDSRCVRCHGPTSTKGGLRLDTIAGIRKGGDGGTVIVPGSSANSVLMAVLIATEDQPRMPPSGEMLAIDQVA